MARVALAKSARTQRWDGGDAAGRRLQRATSGRLRRRRRDPAGPAAAQEVIVERESGDQQVLPMSPPCATLAIAAILAWLACGRRVRGDRYARR